MADLRDVTASSLDIKREIKKEFLFLLRFLRNPLSEIKTHLSWTWQKSILIYALISVTAGFINGLIPPNIYNMAFGLLFMPVITFVTSHILTGFFYYYFQVFERRQIGFLTLFHMVILANIPFLLIHTISSFLPPVTLIGLAFSAFLMIIGLTEKFSLNKKKAIQLVCVLYFMIFSVWIWERISTARF